jgi:phosphomannomutase
MSEPIISVSGLRGIIGESLSPELAIRYSCAFAALAPPGPIVITRDGRTTGRMLADGIRSGLQAVGRNVIDADVAATPTTGVLVRKFSAGGGIQISASHNPPEYNGLKLFSPEGRVLTAAVGKKVIEQYRAGQTAWVSYSKLGSVELCHDSSTPHWELIRSCVNIDRIRQRKFRVVLDANHGSGSVLGGRMLEELGCQVTVLGSDPDGRFEHPPEPTTENLAGVLKKVPSLKADVGFCQDPDADRLAVIDEQGRYLGEEKTLAMSVDHLLRQKPGPIVTNCSTSRMSEDLANKYRVPFYRSAVGEANVVEVMLAHNAMLGGEGNGGIIDPRVGYVRDSFIGMALLLDAMASRQAKISQLADELPSYDIVKAKISLAPDKIPAGLAALEKHFSTAKSDRMDGLRLDWPGKWLLVRASNTEPIVRAIAEAETVAEAQRLCDESAAVLGKM